MSSLNSKIFLLIIAITFLPLAGIGFYSYKLAAKAVEEKTGSEVVNSVKQVGKNVNLRLSAYKKSMNQLITSEEFVKTLCRKDIKASAYNDIVAQQVFKVMLQRAFFDEGSIYSIYLYQNFNNVYIHGNAVMDTEKFAASEIFSQTLKGQGEIFIGTIRAKPAENVTEEQFLVLGRKVVDTTSVADGTIESSIFIFIKESHFSGIFWDTTYSIGEEVFIANSAGQILSHSNPEGSLWKESIPDEFSEALLATGSGYYVSRVREVPTVIVYDTIPSFDLKIMRTIPYSNFTNELRNIAHLTIFMYVVIAVLLLLMSFFVSRSISKPVHQLLKAMKKLQEGDFDSRARINRRDELGIIGEGFNHMAAKLGELVSRLIQEEKQRSEINLTMLQYQISPHFLYNILGTLRLYALEQGASDVAKGLLVLSRLLKRTLSKADAMVDFKTELQNLEDFIYIQKIQYVKELETEYSIPEHIKDYLIPNMLLQPIVENSIFHGFRNKGKKPRLSIKATAEDEDILITIKDNGTGMSAEKLEELLLNKDTKWNFNHIGLKNVEDRLKLYFGDRYGINIISQPERGTEVSFRLPARRKEDSKNVQSYDCG